MKQHGRRCLSVDEQRTLPALRAPFISLQPRLRGCILVVRLHILTGPANMCRPAPLRAGLVPNKRRLALRGAVPPAAGGAAGRSGDACNGSEHGRKRWVQLMHSAAAAGRRTPVTQPSECAF